VLYAELAQIEGPDFFNSITAYDYMREQMAQRLRGYEGHYPWWARLRPKPDLRGRFPHGCFLPGTPAVRLELALPPDRVLLSNEHAWWCVPSGVAVWTSETEWEEPDFASPAAEEAALKEQRRQGEREWPLPEAWHYRIVPSWQRIFDLEATRAEWQDAVQATFERLEWSDVVAVTEFTARAVR